MPPAEPPSSPGPPGPDILFEGAACGLVLTDTSGTLLKVNATFCRWVGYAPEDLLGRRRIQDLFTVGGRLFHQTHWAPLLQIQGSIAEVKLDVMHRDGHKLPMLFNAIRRQHGDAVYDELALVVVTDRQKYERELLLARSAAEAAKEQLFAADRKKDEFLATLAHELRNPLSPMRTVVQLLKLLPLAEPKLAWCRDVLERQVGHMSRLVDDLLDVSRITQGKVELRREWLDLRRAVQVALEAAQPAIEAASHRLDLRLPAAPVMLDADPTRVTQMVQNLLNNAAKYTPAGGTLTLEVTVAPGQALIAVRDTGIGIAPEHLQDVFTLFSQIPSAHERAAGGLGIGLALVKALADLHGGHVTAASEGVGLGSEFVIHLPLAQHTAPAAPAAVPPLAPRADAARRILVVDDNRDAADSLGMLLELAGHELRLAHNGAAALDLAASFRPEVVLLDIGLPVMDGHEVAQRIRQAPWGAGMLLIAVTGWGQQQDREASLHAGFDHHLTKPVQLDLLMPLLRRA